MKNLHLNLFIFPLFMAVLTLVGCRIPEGPDAVGYHFLNALADQDFESAREYATNETAMMLDFMAEMLKAQPTQPKKEENRKIKLKETKIDRGDTTATCVFTINDAEDVPIQLKKRNGAWKAHLEFDMPQDNLSQEDMEFEDVPDSLQLGVDTLDANQPAFQPKKP